MDDEATDLLLLEGKALSTKALKLGKEIVAKLIAQIKDEEVDDPEEDLFQAPINLFSMALSLDPKNAEVKEQIDKLQDVFGDGTEIPRPPPNHPYPYDVIIVGAGAAGIGSALMLTRTFNLDPMRVLLLERDEAVGSSFRKWPKEMRFISPSFNSQGWTNSFDLNSIAFGTSPAYTLAAEHPSGDQYAYYLNALAESAGIQIQFHTEVKEVRPKRNRAFEVHVEVKHAPECIGANGNGNGFHSTTSSAILKSRYIIWAAGEYQYPNQAGVSPMFDGAELCRHNSSIETWEELSAGDDYVIIGGYESGMDAAFNLSNLGKKCTVASSTACWRVVDDDASVELAPYTAERVRKALSFSTPPRLLAPLRVFKVEEQQPDGGEFKVYGRWGEPIRHPGGQHRIPLIKEEDKKLIECGKEGEEVVLQTPHPPLLCTGFQGSPSLGAVRHLFKFGDGEKGCGAGSPLLVKETDESTITPGLFLSGSLVQHDDLSLCFIYKFRQRFGVVADVIARGLDYHTENAVETCRENNMFLDDFECCKGACGESC